MLVAAVVTIIAVALVFDFLNGFHDAANSIATVVSTRVLAPTYAVAWAAFFNFIAAFFGGVKVANTMGKGILDFEMLRAEGSTAVLLVIFSALMGAIVWNLLTWWWGLPSSSSHALTGGLIGATVLSLGVKGLVGSGIAKISLFIIVSPLAGMLLGTTIMIITTWVVHLGKVTPLKADKWFRRLQLISSGFYSFGHGSNDAQKVMGIMAVVLFGTVWQGRPFHIDWWMILSCHAAIALGTFFGGWRIVRTMGHSLTKLQPIGGFCAETGGGIALLISAGLGIPVSTTHTITGAIVGVGWTKGTKAVQWGVAGRIVWAWVFTIPAAASVAAFFYLASKALVAALS